MSLKRSCHGYRGKVEFVEASSAVPGNGIVIVGSRVSWVKAVDVSAVPGNGIVIVGSWVSWVKAVDVVIEVMAWRRQIEAEGGGQG